jgi:ATP-dependent Lon protease
MEAVKLPLLPLRGQSYILFPGLMFHVDLSRPASLAAIDSVSAQSGCRLALGFYKDNDAQRTDMDSLWDVGCEAEIRAVTDLQDGAKRVFLEGIRRIKFCSCLPSSGDSFFCIFNHVEEPLFELTEHLRELATDLQDKAVSLEQTVAFQPLARPKTSADLGRLIDTVASSIPATGRDKISILRAADARKRIEILHMVLANMVERENERLAEQESKEAAEKEAAEKEASRKAAHVPARDAAKDHRSAEIVRLQNMLRDAGLPDEAGAAAADELKRLQGIPPGTGEYSTTMTYLTVLASLPWSKSSQDKMDMDEARRILDEDHYGLKEPKERILEFLAVRKLTGKNGGAILCFAGPPGVGKTSLGQSIAKAMGRVFIRTSLCGVRDEAEIRGHRRTYIGSMPGRILQEMRKAKVRNPVFMLDEVDKLVSASMHGDPSAALLEVLDPEQNHAFKDNYLELGFDLSQVFFIGTANDIHGMLPALRDRLEIVELPGYSAFAKSRIASEHLIPRQREKNGLLSHGVEITDEALTHIIGSYTHESGVRTLERCCGSIFRKLAVHAASGRDVPNPVDVAMVKRLLGPPKLFAERMAEAPQVGTSTGLAWSPCGGSILFIESTLVPGKGGIETTGNLGQVLQESAQVAHTWTMANAARFGIDTDLLEKRTIRVHMPAGATPKDGPSAGVALVASIVSLLVGRAVRNNVAMTGEISLRGRLLPVGGIVEKILAAHRAGIREAVVPKGNADSLLDVPEEVMSEMEIHPLESLDDVLGVVLVDRAH